MLLLLLEEEVVVVVEEVVNPHSAQRAPIRSAGSMRLLRRSRNCKLS